MNPGFAHFIDEKLRYQERSCVSNWRQLVTRLQASICLKVLWMRRAGAVILSSDGKPQEGQRPSDFKFSDL